LPLRNLIILELAAHLGDFKPPHIADCFASSTDRVIHRVFDAVWSGTDQFDLFVDVVTHDRIKAFKAASGEHIPKSIEQAKPPLAAKTNRSHMKFTAWTRDDKESGEEVDA
jgi:Mg/Co/Ni transporter MgtE